MQIPNGLHRKLIFATVKRQHGQYADTKAVIKCKWLSCKTLMAILKTFLWSFNIQQGEIGMNFLCNIIHKPQNAIDKIEMNDIGFEQDI